MTCGFRKLSRTSMQQFTEVNGQDNPADLFTKHLPRESIIRDMSRLGFRLIDQKDNEIGNKDVDRSWQVEEEYEDQEDQEAGIDESIAVCDQAYGSLICLILEKSAQTRATSVDSQVGNVESRSPNNKSTAQSDSWSDIVKKKTTTNPTSTRISLTARPTLSPGEVQKIMKEAAQRAEQVVREALRKTSFEEGNLCRKT